MVDQGLAEDPYAYVAFGALKEGRSSGCRRCFGPSARRQTLPMPQPGL